MKKSLRSLHVDADAALIAYEQAKATRKAAREPLELRPAILALHKADRALDKTCHARNMPTKDLCDAMWGYLDNPLIARWDALVAAWQAIEELL